VYIFLHTFIDIFLTSGQIPDKFHLTTTLTMTSRTQNIALLIQHAASTENLLSRLQPSAAHAASMNTGAVNKRDSVRVRNINCNHTRERNHECAVCRLKFANAGALATHKLMKHPFHDMKKQTTLQLCTHGHARAHDGVASGNQLGGRACELSESTNINQHCGGDTSLEIGPVLHISRADTRAHTDFDQQEEDGRNNNHH
jgi:hypothetical protein